MKFVKKLYYHCGRSISIIGNDRVQYKQSQTCTAKSLGFERPISIIIFVA